MLFIETFRGTLIETRLQDQAFSFQGFKLVVWHASTIGLPSFPKALVPQLGENNLESRPLKDKFPSFMRVPHGIERREAPQDEKTWGRS